MPTTIPAHSLGNTTFFLHTFIINLHSPFFFILTHLYSYFVIHFYPLKTVDQTVESLYFLNIFSQRSSLNFYTLTLNANFVALLQKIAALTLKQSVAASSFQSCLNYPSRKYLLAFIKCPTCAQDHGLPVESQM